MLTSAVRAGRTATLGEVLAFVARERGDASGGLAGRTLAGESPLRTAEEHAAYAAHLRALVRAEERRVERRRLRLERAEQRRVAVAALRVRVAVAVGDALRSIGARIERAVDAALDRVADNRRTRSARVAWRRAIAPAPVAPALLLPRPVAVGTVIRVRRNPRHAGRVFVSVVSGPRAGRTEGCLREHAHRTAALLQRVTGARTPVAVPPSSVALATVDAAQRRVDAEYARALRASVDRAARGAVVGFASASVTPDPSGWARVRVAARGFARAAVVPVAKVGEALRALAHALPGTPDVRAAAFGAADTLAASVARLFAQDPPELRAVRATVNR